MNSNLFCRIMRQSNIKIDRSYSKDVIPNTIKIIKTGDLYYAFRIDEKMNKTLIVETENEKKVYNAIVKHLGIKLNKFGDATNKKRK